MRIAAPSASLDRGARAGGFALILAVMIGVAAVTLSAIYLGLFALAPAERALAARTLWAAFALLSVIAVIAALWLARLRARWLAAEIDAAQQISRLRAEVAAQRDMDAALERAKAVAEAANLAKSRYLVGVSHEIRSPLNAIYGYAQLLERRSGINAQEAGGVIRRSSEHLTNIVDGLLDISCIESGILKLNRDLVPLPAFLESITEMFRIQAENKGLVFHYRAAQNLPAFVRTDEKRLRQILINLLSNAIKYTPAGSASLTVRYSGLVAEFEVADTGIGIPAAEIERIFEPFERGSAEQARAQPGTGLGLAITRVLAQVMGGDVAVTSTPDKGSVFKLRLMLAAPGDAVAATARQRVIKGYTGRRRTILLIDDDPLQLSVLQSLLRPLEFSVFAASNGPDGIDLAVHCAPDLVLLDLQMPGLSGWEVAAQLRAGAATANGSPLKILIVSANAHEFAAGGDGLAAHDGFLAKPVELEALLDAVAGQLGLEWVSEALKPSEAVPGGADLAVPAARIAELRRLGQAGHIRGIEAALAVLAEDIPASKPLIAQLDGYVRDFDLAGFLRVLDAHG